MEGYTNSGSYKKGQRAKNWNGIVSGDVPWNKGVYYVLESHFKKGQRPSVKTEFKSGPDHPSWKGGITPKSNKLRNQYGSKLAEWRKSVFKRDNYTCQICGERGGDIQANHIKPFAYFPEERLNINNGETLCVKCHRKTDSYGGRAWVNYL